MGAGIALVILTPRYGCSEKQNFDCLNRLLIPGRTDPADGHKIEGRTIIMRKDEHPVRVARTILVQEAMAGAPNADYYLWIDDDMTFDPYAAMRLIEQAEIHKLDIVGGLCFNRRHPYGPTLFKHFPPELERGKAYGIQYSYPPDTLIEVDATGHGFVLVRADVYKKMENASWYLPYGDELSEDVGFCARAKDLGIQTWVDTGCKIGHIGKVVIDEAFAEKNREFEHETWWQPGELSKDGAPVATVVIPTYNQNPRYLKAAILSAMYQTVPVEVIVVDDGSDVPVSVPKGVRLVRHDFNKGIAAALNSGIEAMSTDWFCWLSSDDLFDNRKVQFQLSAALQSGTKALFHMFQVEGKGFATVPMLHRWRTMAEQAYILGQGCAINGSTIMVHRDVIAAVGEFDQSYKYGQDWEWFCRVGRRYHWHPVFQVLCTRRTDGNLTERINADPELAAVRDAEDARIRATYGAM